MGATTITDDFNGDGVKETVTLDLTDKPNGEGDAEYKLTIKRDKQTFYLGTAQQEW